MADKITNRDILNLIANGTSNDATIEWAKGMLAKMDEKNAKRKNTETKEQKENKVLMGTILANLSAGTPTVASTLGTILGVSTQKASSLCTLLVNEGKAVAVEVKVKGRGKVKGYLLPSPTTDEVAE